MADALEKIYSVYSAAKLYPQVWAWDNGGVPRLELVVRDDIIQSPVYSIRTLSKNITVKPFSSVEIYNYVFVRYTDENGQPQIISPESYPSLADGDPVDLGLNRKDYYHDAGEVSLAEALQAGEGIIAEFKIARDSGQVTIIGPDGILSYDTDSEGIGIHPATVKAMRKMVLVGHVAYDGTPDPVYQIRSARYNVGSGKLVLQYGDPGYSQAIFEGLKKKANSNK